MCPTLQQRPYIAQQARQTQLQQRTASVNPKQPSNLLPLHSLHSPWSQQHQQQQL
jgi:hypothetical protein